jgi:hypothetical protein
MLGLEGSPYALFGKVLFALTVLGGSQLLSLGLFAKTHARNIGLESSSRISEWVEKIFTLEKGLIVATGLVVVGLAMVLAQVVAGLGTIGAGGASASILILGLVSFVLGSKLWFDAFFLSMIMFRPPSGGVIPKPEADAGHGAAAVTRVSVAKEGLPSPVTRGVGQGTGIA